VESKMSKIKQWGEETMGEEAFEEYLERNGE
jgi:hypothetical protein